METIINYYRLCGIFPHHAHVINDLSDKQISVIFTKKELKLFMRKDGVYRVNEFVIGSNEPVKDMKVIVI